MMNQFIFRAFQDSFQIPGLSRTGGNHVSESKKYLFFDKNSDTFVWFVKVKEVRNIFRKILETY